MSALPRWGTGLGWRRETAWLIDQRADLSFSEVIAEDLDPAQLPDSLKNLVARGLPIVPHGVSLGLGGADLPDSRRLEHLARLAEALGSPFVSEHIAFVRSDGREAGHLLPVARTHEALSVLVENVELAQRALPVPLVLENTASIFEWPAAELSEADFLRQLFDATGAGWLLDVANLYANAANHGFELDQFLEHAPLARVVYAHMAGGEAKGGVYHDTHAHALGPGPLELLERVLRRTGRVPILLERDRDFGPRLELEAELDTLTLTLGRAEAGAERVG